MFQNRRSHLVFKTLVILLMLVVLVVQSVPAQENTPPGPANGPSDPTQEDLPSPEVTSPELVAQITLTANDSGSYLDTGFHNPTNENYIVGRCPSCAPAGDYRNFFAFDLSSVTHKIQRAKLRIYNPPAGYNSPDASETWTVYNVWTPIASLLDGSAGLAAYNDLGSGSSYGSVTVTSASNDSYVEVNLNESGISQINGSVGGTLALGGALTTLVGPAQQSMFAWTSLASGVELILTGFQDDFQGGFSNWTSTGLWNLEQQSDTCGAIVAPFPSPISAAYYGQDGICDYDTGTNSGSLTLSTPVRVSPGDVLSFWSYEQTENDIGFDSRYVEIFDGTWTILGQLTTENMWYQQTFDLASFVGQDVIVRFRFDSVDDKNNSNFGWMVDNVKIGPLHPPLAADDSSFQRLFAIPFDTSGDIVELDPLTGSELNRFTPPEPPSAVGADGLAFDGESLWFINEVGTTIYKLNPDTGAEIASKLITAGTGFFDGLAALGGLIYIMDYIADDILVFDPGTQTVIDTLDIDVINSVSIIGGLAGISGPDALIVTDGSSTVYEINPATGLVVNSFREDFFFDTGVAVLDGQIYLGSLGSDDEFKVHSRNGLHLRSVNLPYPVSALGGDDVTSPMKTLEDTLLATTVKVLINDGDLDLEPLGIGIYDAVSVHGGVVTNNGDGTFGYNPALNYCGPDTFTYTIEDLSVLTDTGTVMIDVVCVNDPPVLDPIGDKVVDELTLLSFTATATDPDLTDILTFSLDPGAPIGASINPVTGQFTWTPTEIQGPGIYPVTVRVTDDGIPPLDDFETFNITVNEVNQAPVLDPIGNRSVETETLLTFTASASDADLPANTLTFSLDASAPAGASIHPTTGVFTWTPSEAQGLGIFPVTVRVTDNGIPVLDDFENLNILVYDATTLQHIYLPIVIK